MNFLDLCKERYSVRKFSDKPIEPDVLAQILEAGRVAPTAKNNQPQRIYVLQSEEALAKIRSITRFSFNAPVVLLICGDISEGWINPFNDRNGTEMDVSIVTTQMMLQTTALGLGSTWVCWFDMAVVKEQFNLPEQIEPYAILPIGYPSEQSIPSPSHENRKTLDETVQYL